MDAPGLGYDQCRALVNAVRNLGVPIKGCEFLY
jgi:hypothetical protein